MVKRKKSRGGGSAKPGNGRKLGPTIKKYGWFRGPGKYARTQTGLPFMEKAVPLALSLVAIAAITPALGSQISQSLQGVPVAGPVATTLSNYGASIRNKFMTRNG